jgi:hypothetical protein
MLNEARQELAAAEAEERQAHRRWEQAQSELENAKRKLERLESRP